MSKLYSVQNEQGHSREFFNYVRCIGESRSKQEEDRVVQRDLSELKKAFADPDLDKSLLKELVVRVFYAEMLGHSAEFGHIHCVNLSSSQDLLLKRVGYLGTWLTVPPEHNLMYLVASSLQRDMKSTNFLHVAAALTSVSKIARYDLLNAINTEVIGLLNHSSPLVRKKAVIAMHAFYRRTRGTMGDPERFRQALLDRDPSVAGAALSLFQDVVRNDPLSNRHLIGTFISMLRKIIEHHLPVDYNYQHVPAPWFQMRILKILTMLVGEDTVLAQQCEDVLVEVITRADVGTSMGYAVICEAIQVVTRIPHTPLLLELVVQATSKLLSGKNVNWRCAGIQALSQIALINPDCVREHQHVIMTCLEDGDEVIRRKTMVLLLAMCNEGNVDIITTRVVKCMSQQTDIYARRELAQRVCRAVELFSCGSKWYIDTMNKILLCASQYVPHSAVQGMLKFIVEGEGTSEREDVAFRVHCVKSYFCLLETTRGILPDVLYQVAAWIIGEYGFLSKQLSSAMLVDRLCDTLERAESDGSRCWVIMALMKIVSAIGSMPTNVEQLMGQLKSSRSIAVQQRCYEFLELARFPELLKRVLPLDGCCEDVEVDESMSFLDEVVRAAEQAGAKSYKGCMRHPADKQESILRTRAYEVQQPDIISSVAQQLPSSKVEETAQLTIQPTIRRWGFKNAALTPAMARKPNTDLESWDSTRENGSFAAPSMVCKPMVAEKDVKVFSMVNSEPSTTVIGNTSKCKKNEDFLNNVFGRGAQKGKIPVVPPSPVCVTDFFQSFEGKVDVEGDLVPPRIHIERSLAETAMGIIVRITSASRADNVVVSMLAPMNCTIRNTSCSLTTACIKNDQKVILHSLHAGEAIEIRAELVPSAFPTSGQVMAELSYQGARESLSASYFKPVTSSLTLLPTDVLRPPPQMSATQFGELWTRFEDEHRSHLHISSPITLEYLQQLLMERASMCAVEVICNEMIVAAVLIGIGELLLGHAAIAGSHTAIITLRSRSRSFTEFVARALSA
ncbi:putative Adaptin N terminal region Adaptin AP4 complex epsilon appendage platform [Trypanosoma vivax]|uniref:AP-4 complex subunit epsilon n=1 Tax=Trypanosoma vivax (strain Y486) TaxID=1055687 RepID=G0TWW5_TRYVY|nr:putative Adaptin N terminal region Adaptin AP4 complex epsilon appendage platform [Trypanosoma vivax]CCC48453.1 putative AP-1/4 adapter complex gamma/epsilon subunit [Trypanosoma vivax Y486]